MGLLDDPEFNPQGYGGVLGSLMYRSPSADEATLAQWARDAAAAHIARGRGGSRAYDVAASSGNGAFPVSSAPFGFAGPGSLNFDPGMNADGQGVRSFEASYPPVQQASSPPVLPSAPLLPTGLTPDEVALAHRAKADAAARLGQLTNSIVRSAASSTPVIGDFNNRINAGINATIAPALNPLFKPEDRLSEPLWRERYNHSLRDQGSHDARFSEEHPYLDAGANFAGGSLASELVAGAVPWAARAGAPLAEKIIRDFGTQAALWGADALARGGDVEKGMERGMARGAGREFRNEAWRALLKLRPS